MNYDSALFSLVSLLCVLNDHCECINPLIHACFCTDSHCCLHIAFPLSNHLSHTSLSLLILHGCYLFASYFQCKFLLRNPIFLYCFFSQVLAFCYVFLYCIFLLSFSSHLLPHVLFLFSSSTCIASRSQTPQLHSYIPRQSSHPSFLSSSFSYWGQNLVSKTSLHSSPRSVEVGFNIRTLFRSSLVHLVCHPEGPKGQNSRMCFVKQTFQGLQEAVRAHGNWTVFISLTVSAGEPICEATEVVKMWTTEEGEVLFWKFTFIVILFDRILCWIYLFNTLGSICI